MTSETTGTAPEGDGLSRRSLIKRGAAVGGALVWTTPVVQSLGSTAYAATSPLEPCAIKICLDRDPGPVCVAAVCLTNVSVACCDAVNAANAQPDPVLRFIAYLAALAGPCNTAVPVACV